MVLINYNIPYIQLGAGKWGAIAKKIGKGAKKVGRKGGKGMKKIGSKAGRGAKKLAKYAKKNPGKALKAAAAIGAVGTVGVMLASGMNLNEIGSVFGTTAAGFLAATGTGLLEGTLAGFGIDMNSPTFKFIIFLIIVAVCVGSYIYYKQVMAIM
jgi:hypothetical protein